MSSVIRTPRLLHVRVAELAAERGYESLNDFYLAMLAGLADMPEYAPAPVEKPEELPLTA